MSYKMQKRKIKNKEKLKITCPKNTFIQHMQIKKILNYFNFFIGQLFHKKYIYTI